MARKKTRYFSVQELNHKAASTPFKFLNRRVEQLLEKGWNAHSVQSQVFQGRELNVVTLTYDGRIVLIYPNGLTVPQNKKGKVTWLWRDVAAKADATIPAPGYGLEEV